MQSNSSHVSRGRIKPLCCGLLVVCITVGFLGPANGQTRLGHVTKPVRVLNGIGEATIAGDALILADGAAAEIITAHHVCITGADDCQITLEAETKSRDIVCVEKITNTEWLILSDASIHARATAINFENPRFESLRFVIQGRAPPEPEPDPPGPDPPGPEPPPEPDANVPNQYGLGSIAYKLAPRNDPATLNRYRQMYFQAAEFLYGRPTAKAVYLTNPADQANPDRSVMAWITAEYAKTVCTDEAICKKWAAWREALHQRANAVQRERQMTRADWYQAFREISTALEAVN